MDARTLMVGALPIVCGCWAPYTTISSNRVPSLPAPLTVVFVVSGVGTSEDASPASFRSELARIGSVCGLRLGVSEISRIDLDLRVHSQRAKNFGARYVLTLQPTERLSHTGGGWGGNGGYRVTETTITYDAMLYGDSPDHLLWRADVRLNLGHPSSREEAATRLAHDVFEKLILDGVVASCNASRPPPAPPAQAPPPVQTPPADDGPDDGPVPYLAPATPI
jgi:hypothetical protein